MDIYTLKFVSWCVFIFVFFNNYKSYNGETVSVSKDMCYCVQELVTGLRGPLSVAFFSEDGEERLVVAQQFGKAEVYTNTGKKLRTFLDLSRQVVITNNPGESRGLLSLVLDPNYDVTGKVFVYSIRKENNKDYAYVSMFKTKDGIVDTDSEQVLIKVYQPYEHGNGGPMLFGDDGYLYIFTGDGGEQDDRSGLAQDIGTLHGKALRIDVRDSHVSTDKTDGNITMFYTSPSTNPFIADDNGRDEIFALGIRNMWGCSQDSTSRGGSGKIFCAETGTNKFDEINIIERGKNYGWPIKEGTVCYNGTTCKEISNEGVPIHEFAHQTYHALVGGFVYRGKQFKEMTKKVYYTYGDVVHGRTYLLEEGSGGVWTQRNWSHCALEQCPANAKADILNHLLSWGQDTQGELYMLMTHDLVGTKASGKLFRIVPPSSSSSAILPQLWIMFWVAVYSKLICS